MREQGESDAGRYRARNEEMKLLVIDNYDSFTYNLVQLFGEMDVDLTVKRNDALSFFDRAPGIVARFARNYRRDRRRRNHGTATSTISDPRRPVSSRIDPDDRRAQVAREFSACLSALARDHLVNLADFTHHLFVFVEPE